MYVYVCESVFVCVFLFRCASNVSYACACVCEFANVSQCVSTRRVHVRIVKNHESESETTATNISVEPNAIRNIKTYRIKTTHVNSSE